MISARAKKKIKPETKVIIDIGSARVSGVLLTDWPKTEGEVSLAPAWQATPDWDRFRQGIEQTLKTVLHHLGQSARRQPPTEVVVFLASPFFVGQASLVRTSQAESKEITPPYLAELVKNSFATNRELNSPDLVLIEDEILDLKLDGYPVDKPLGQMASQIELFNWRSGTPLVWLQHWEELIHAEFPKAKIRWQSFTYASYTVFKDLLPDRDWILLDTGNELTDVLVIKNGQLAEHFAFPQGKNQLIRTVAEKLQTVPAEATSLLNRQATGKNNRSQSARLQSALASAGQDWSEHLLQALTQVLQTTILPETIYLFGDEPSDELFVDFIKQAKLSTVTASRRPIKIVYIEKPLTKAFHDLTGRISPPIENSFLLAEALFCVKLKDNKLNNWPFNQLATTMQDIIKNKKKSLRDIFPENKNNSEKKDEEELSFKTTGYVPASFRLRTGRLGLPTKIGIGLLSLAVLALIGFGISSYFAKVTVQVTPRQGRLMISNVYEASKTGDAGLKFVLASNLQATDKVNLPATGTETVNLKAKGTITIYNNYSTQAQTLVAQTRFETNQGLIYRIEKQISVPGQKKNDQGELVPGEITATVVADKAGANYNLPSGTKFTIPGFKGGTRFDKFSAQSQGEITGGLIGQRPKVTDTDLNQARNTLKGKLLAAAAEKLQAQVPDDYILFPEATIASFAEEINVSQTQTDQAELKLTATVTGLLFNKQELAANLAKQQVPDYKNEPLTITNWSDFKFSFLEEDRPTSASVDKIKFKLDGTGRLVWDFSEKDLKDKLQTVDVKDYKTVFNDYFPTIQMATIVFYPPWIRSIPTDPEKIEIVVDLSQS